MDQKYEEAKWYKIDVLLDWDPLSDQPWSNTLYSKVAVFINGTYIQ